MVLILVIKFQKNFKSQNSSILALCSAPSYLSCNQTYNSLNQTWFRGSCQLSSNEQKTPKSLAIKWLPLYSLPLLYNSVFSICASYFKVLSANLNYPLFNCAVFNNHKTLLGRKYLLRLKPWDSHTQKR